jgi:hypothetical protein
MSPEEACIRAKRDSLFALSSRVKSLRESLKNRILEFWYPPFRSFKDVHRGKAIIVCGCGQSALNFKRPASALTIGVNDFGRKFDPDYLLVMDPPGTFTPARFHYIENSRARYVFSDQYFDLKCSKLVRFKLHQVAKPKFDDPNSLFYIDKPITSPFMAVNLAAHMGAGLIGLIGVDYTENHFFAATGSHVLTPHLEGIDRRFFLLLDALQNLGIKFFNLSPESLLRSVPKISINDFTAEAGRLSVSRR